MPDEIPGATEVDEVTPQYEPEQNGHTPPTVFEGLQEQYRQATDERRKTLPIAPGRFGGNLAVLCKPAPWHDYRKRAERLMGRGHGEEAELQFAAETIAQCCDTILYRPADHVDLIPMAEAYPAWRDGPPVRFDERLAEAVGLENPPRSAAGICRMVFKQAAALNDFYVALDAWLKEATPSDGEDPDDEIGRQVPPT